MLLEFPAIIAVVVVMMLSSSTTTSTSTTHPSTTTTLDVKSYLLNTLHAAQDMKSIPLQVTEQDRKTMIRCLLGNDCTTTKRRSKYDSASSSNSSNSHNNDDPHDKDDDNQTNPVLFSKVDFEEQLRQVQLQLLWTKARDLCRMLPKDVIIADAPNYQSGVLHAQQPESWQNNNKENDNNDKNKGNIPIMNRFQTPTKFFSYLARGRTYQGQFERLLSESSIFREGQQQQQQQQTCDLLELYQTSILKKVTLRECMIELLHDDTYYYPYPHERYDDIMRCIELELPEQSFQPIDGGQSLGKRGELDLKSYLISQQQKQQNHNDDNNDNQDDTAVDVDGMSNRRHRRRRVVFHVLVKSTKRIKSKKPSKDELVLEVKHDLEAGRTTEFDAMVLEIDHTTTPSNSTNSDNNTMEQAHPTKIRILEMWEAKSTIHPGTLCDVMYKKVQSMEQILNNNNNNDKKNNNDDNNHNNNNKPTTFMNIYLDGERYPVDVSSSSSSSSSYDTTSNMPRVGIFGSGHLPPKIAARRLQQILFEQQLSKDPHVVLEILNNHGMTVNSSSSPDISSTIYNLLHDMERIHPMVILAHDKKNDGT